MAQVLIKKKPSRLNYLRNWPITYVGLGHAAGQFMFGLKYQYGYAVEKELAKAAEWYQKSAEQGNAEGQWRFGLMYQHGHGVEKDLVKASEWYRKSIEQGDAKAHRLLIAMTESEELRLSWLLRNGILPPVSK